MDNSFPLLILKFSDRPFSESMVNEGEIFMKPLKDHKEHGENRERQDPYEGAIDNVYRENQKILLGLNLGEPFKELNVLHSNTNRFSDLTGKVCYSMVGITLEDIRNAGHFKLDPELRKFGNTFTMIRNVGEFFNRIDSWLDINGHSFERGFVTYWDRKVDQKLLTPFHKKSDHRHHNEYRYIVDYVPDSGPLKFHIGNISEFSHLEESNIIDTMTIKLPDPI